MSTPTVSFGITTFNDPARLNVVLNTLRWLSQKDGIDYFEFPVRVFEDPWIASVQETYELVCQRQGVPFYRLPEWSCMQGSAQFAVEHSPEDWFIYLPDDALPTPGCLSNLLTLISRFDATNVAAFQTPYWNADELPSPPWNGAGKNAMWEMSPEWLESIPRNPKWDQNGIIPYMNLNGAGFVLRRSAWEAVGGFSQETWCLDEDISARIWTRTREIIVAVPGPPVVHYMGGALQHPEHHFHCLDCWERAGWPRDKDNVLHPHLRQILRMRTGWGREMEADGDSPAQGGFWR